MVYGLQMNWSLRPERLDAYALFEGKKDRHRYDFDATYIRQPRYEFSDTFSPALMKLDLRALAESEATLEVCITRVTSSRLAHLCTYRQFVQIY